MNRRASTHVMRIAVVLCHMHVVSGGDTVAPQFDDASDLLDMQHLTRANGGSGMGGAAWFDYDADGLLDLFLANGVSRQSRLFRNTGTGAFEDVTLAVGLVGTSGHAGVVTADIDNDGYVDLLLTSDTGVEAVQRGDVTLFRNVDGVGFEDITDTAGLVGPETPLSAAFGDIDNDGFLDLFVTATGSLATFEQHHNRLYRNNGDLTFTDISAGSGVDTALGACAAFFSHFDEDGRIDLLVANCNEVHFRPAPLQLMMNQGNGHFEDGALRAGLAVDGYWMGVGPADYDNDGDTDIFVTNLGRVGGPIRFNHALYEQGCAGRFYDNAAAAGMATREFGWGVAPADFDNDGWADIFFAGSLVTERVEMRGPGRGNPGTLLMNNRDGTFTNHTAAIPVNLENQLTSGVAYGDFDGDGFSDVVVVVEGLDGDPGRPVLLKSVPNGHHWLTVKLRGTISNRDAVGARVTVFADDLVQMREIYAGASFLSSHSPWLTFGLARRNHVDRVVVQWPSGLHEEFSVEAIDRSIELLEGQGGSVQPAEPVTCVDSRTGSNCGAGVGVVAMLMTLSLVGVRIRRCFDHAGICGFETRAAHGGYR